MHPEQAVYAALFGERRDLDEKLERALGDHCHYWTGEDRALDASGWIAWPLVAASVVAWGSLDVPIEARSDYLPLELVRGAW